MSTAAVDSASWLHRLLRDAHLRACSVAALALPFLPPDGISGLQLCPFHAWTGLPCPGCGLTRCGSHLLHGHFARAVDYHPFGLVIIPLLFILGILGVLPWRWRERIRGALVPGAVHIRRIFWLSAGVFAAFGLLRSIGVLMGWMDFPATWL